MHLQQFVLTSEVHLQPSTLPSLVSRRELFCKKLEYLMNLTLTHDNVSRCCRFMLECMRVPVE